MEHPRSVCWTDDMSEIFVHFRRCLCCLLPLFAAMSSYKFTPRAVASPDTPQKPLARKRARSGGAQWVRVTRHEPGSQAKIPWRKVGLIKQRNVDLTTDGLWAIPLNEGWVPVKARRLQDWQN